MNGPPSLVKLNNSYYIIHLTHIIYTIVELKQFGFINKEIQKALLKNKKNTYVPKWGISPAEYDLAVSEVLDEYEEFKSFSRFNCWIARKPTTEEL